MWRHGDVLIARIDALPASATATQGSILARGEITGHSHRVETAEYAILYTDSGGATGMLYLHVLNPVRIIHEEHHPIILEPGMYRVWQQREYTPDAIRMVRD